MDHNYEAKYRIFLSMRMSPWEPEHKLFIDSELAKMDFLDPVQAKSLRKEYEDRLKNHESSKKAEEPVKKDEVVIIEPEKVAPKIEKKKKKLL